MSLLSGPSAPISLSSRPPSRLSTSVPRANAAAASTSLLLPLPGHSIDSQSPTDHPMADRAQDDLDGEPQPAPQLPTLPCIGDPYFAQTTASSHTIAQHSPYLTILPEPLVSIQQPLYKDTRMFDRASKFNVTGGTFIAGDVTYHDAFSTWFMEKLLEKAIPGAEFDSSARYPPPRCHPGTRLAALERCLQFISSCDGMKKMRWVFGAAGVGKTAIMQSIAEFTELLFAAKSDSYRRVIEHEIGTRDGRMTHELRTTGCHNSSRGVVCLNLTAPIY